MADLYWFICGIVLGGSIFMIGKAWVHKIQDEDQHESTFEDIINNK